MKLTSLLKLPICVVAMGLVLAGCGNDTGSADMKKVFLSTLPDFSGKNKKAPPSVQTNVGTVLKSTPKPLALVELGEHKSAAFVVEIERNGPYRTFATAQRQSIVMRQGVVTATRGLGNDLMSSSVSGSLNLITQRRAGAAQRVMRYLDGENITRELVFDCKVSVGGSEGYSAGEIHAQTRIVTEACTSPVRSFTNRYLVSNAGMVLSSTQWLSPIGGSAQISILRN
ncbi:YjbF family lipoprotein [Thalassovita taeanensis]|nr:YjbF family lipoprotein [Thalassovita taeanensis]